MSYESAVMLGGVGVLWFLGVLLVNTDDDHSAIKLFYLLISMWFMVAIINMGMQLAIDGAAGDAVINSINIVFKLVVWIARIVSAYFLFYYLWYVLNLIKEKVDKSGVAKFGK